jgi:hypothetical protein
MKHSVLVLLALLCVAGVTAAPPTCPDVGTVDVHVLNSHDPHWYDVPTTTVTLTWEWAYYSNPENYVLEVWTWDAGVERWRVWQVEPLGRGVAWLDHPELTPAESLRFFVRDTACQCARVEWVFGGLTIENDPPPVPLHNSAWVWDSRSRSFVLKPVVIRGGER